MSNLDNTPLGEWPAEAIGEFWKQYAADFNAMTDAEVESERRSAQALADEQQDWLDAVASWEAAGRPRDTK